MSERHIEVWYDETSDCEEPVYCVSLCEADGQEIRCLGSYEEREDAEARAERAAERLGLEVVAR